jgi:limonene 1,2-monooxygenase
MTNLNSHNDQGGITRAELRAGVFTSHWQLPLHKDPTLSIRQEMDFMIFLDEIGYDEAWVGEHHSGGMELVGSPEIMIAATIERTRRIKLGTGVISLPYRNPFIVADTILQLDHQSRGRVMFGFGPGLLPADAKMLGIPADKQRGRMAEALDVVIRLLNGETVTEKTEWYDLRQAFLHYAPYTYPRPELAVASAITPSGGKIAGRYGLGMLCVAAASGPGFDVLDLNWKLAREAAVQHTQTIHPTSLRLVAPIHIAETRDQAIAEIKEGYERWRAFQNESMEDSAAGLGYGSIEQIIDSKLGAIGTAEDGVEMLERFWEKTGGFGCILAQVNNWASFEATKRSHRMFVEYVMPQFTGRCKRRFASHAYASENRVDLKNTVMGAAKKAIDEHFQGHK